MANQTITTAVNYDSDAISGLLNGETMTLNGGVVTIDADVRHAQQAAVFGSVTISATLGGSLVIDGRNVWQIEFDASTGNVPALAALGSNTVTGGTSGATGELIRVYDGVALAPLAAGGAMPASGYIKLRSKTGTFLDNEVITLPGGATVTVNSLSGGRRSWIEVVGAQSATLTVPRLGSFVCRGDWFSLGVTSGAANQTFQLPVADVPPAIQIETAPGSGVYEWWLCAGDRWGNATGTVAQDARGKFFGAVAATGVITIANTATGAACGLLPAAGCNVRIPNVFLCSAAATDYETNTRHTTLGTRFDLTTTGGGLIDIELVTCNWYLSCTAAFSTRVVFSSISGFLFSNIATEAILEDCGHSYSEQQALSNSFSNCFSGVRVKRNRMARFISASAAYVVTFMDCTNLDIDDNYVHSFGGTLTTLTRGHATHASFLFTRCATALVNNTASIGSRIGVVTCADFDITNTTYADLARGVTTTSTGVAAFDVSAFCLNIRIAGFANFAGLTNVQPYAAILNTTNSNDVILENIGSPTAVYPSGTVNQIGSIFTASIVKGLTVRRVYTDNTRSFAWVTANTVQSVVVENVWADGADATNTPSIDQQTRGCRVGIGNAQTSCYGTHWLEAFTGATSGILQILFNEAIASTADQCQITAGTPKFTAAGTLAFDSVGDEVTWTCPWTIIGHTSFGNAPTTNGTNLGFLIIEYQVNTGSGWSAWKEATNANMTAEVINSVTGFQFKARVRRITAGAQSVFTGLRFITNTTAVAQRQQYPDGSVVAMGAQSTDTVELRRATDDSLVTSITGSGTLRYVSESGVMAYLVRKNMDGHEIMRTRATPFELVPNSAGAKALYAGDEVQIAAGSGGVTTDEIRAELAPELALIGLIPAAL